MYVTSDQTRAAQALPRLDQPDLARLAHMPAHMPILAIQQIEAASGDPALSFLDTLRVALEQAGAEFISDGVRRRPPPAAPAVFGQPDPATPSPCL